MMGYIRNTVPLGIGRQKKSVDEAYMPDMENFNLPFLKDKRNKMLHEIGTLGGGNHFIEIQKDAENEDVWAMAHSGSRNTGLLVANYYNKIAEQWCSRWYSDLTPGFAFLPIEFVEGKNYMSEMNFCVQLAFANRKAIMERIKEAFVTVRPSVTFEPMINIAHNYAALENHFGKDVIVHRKGATSAYAGEIGIIPGSMGTKSYIVEGLGNPDSFMSCSHGAGRRMSRSVAFATLSLEEECKKMDDLGIIHGLRHNGLDEAPDAYKDICTVIANESDLVSPITELLPIAVIKGD